MSTYDMPVGIIDLDKEVCDFFGDESYSTVAKIDFIGSVIERYDLKPSRANSLKDDNRAAQTRRSANHYYSSTTDRDLVTALKQCNESICLATNGSVSLSKGYFNRSAMCLDMEAFSACLSNITILREFGPAADLLQEQINVHEERCREEIANHKEDKYDIWDKSFPKEMHLSYPANPRNPRMVDFIELHETEALGRHLICNRDVGVGEALIIDEPFSVALFRDYTYTHCQHCHVECPYTAIPCEGCISAMFCSERCRSQAYEQYHKYECPIFTDIRATFTEVGQLAIRTFLKAFVLFNGRLIEMKTYLERRGQRNIDDFDWTNIKPKHYFQAIVCLSTNEDKRDGCQMMNLCFEAYLISDALLRRTAVGKHCKLSHQQSYLKKIILHLMQVGCVGRASLLRFTGYKSAYEVASQAESYGIGTLPVLGSINHSCIPNLFPIHGRGDRVGLFTYRPIKKGDQLTISYGVSYTDRDRHCRQDILRRYFDFECDCEACVHNYPPRFELDQPDFPLDETQLTQAERKKIKRYDPVLSVAKLHYAKRVVTACCESELHLKFNCSRQFGLLTQCLQGTYCPPPVLRHF